MKKLLLVILVLLVAGGVFLYYPRASGTSAANAATIAVLSAGVESQKSGAGFLPALDGDILGGGDQVRADQQGRAVLSYFDGSSLTVEPGSLVKVTQLERVGSDGLVTTIEVTSGRIWASVERLKPGSRFEVRTPATVATVRGTAFEITVAVDGTTVVKTTEGEVVVQAQGQQQSVTAGNENTTPPGGPPSTPTPQPPAPRLRLLSQLNGLAFTVIDPRGRTCGSTGGQLVRQIPGCNVVLGGAGAGSEQADIGEVVAGTYTMLMTSSAALNGINVAASGGTNLDQPSFSQQFSDPAGIRPGDLVKTTFDVTLQGTVVGARPFTASERLATTCGAEVRGRVFSGGTIAERLSAVAAFAQTNRNQPAAIVLSDRELTAEAQSGLKQPADAPARVSDLSVAIDAAGAHLKATVQAGPLKVPGAADLIAGAAGGKLTMRIRSLDLGPLPDALKAQFVPAIERSLGEFAQQIPLNVQRVSLRPGCIALIGTTP